MEKIAKITLWAVIAAGSILAFYLLYVARLETKEFFDTYENVFSGIGCAVVAVGLIFTWVQIRAAKRRSRARTSYQIHKDGREIFLSLSDEVINYIEGKHPEGTDADKVRANAKMKIHEILMYYASVYHQWRFGNIDDQYFKNVILKELCNFLRHHRVKEYWENNVVAMRLWDEKFIRMGQECFN